MNNVRYKISLALLPQTTVFFFYRHIVQVDKSKSNSELINAVTDWQLASA